MKRKNTGFDPILHEICCKLVESLGEETLKEKLGLEVWDFYKRKKQGVEKKTYQKIHALQAKMQKNTRLITSLKFHKGRNFPTLEAYRILTRFVQKQNIIYIDRKFYTKKEQTSEVSIFGHKKLCSLSNQLSSVCNKNYSIEETAFLLKHACAEHQHISNAGAK